MYSRILQDTVLRQATYFPIVALTGPRQSGKTTLAKSVFADKPYVSLEDPAEREFAMSDPRGFFARFDNLDGAIFDEAQRWPNLFSYLQGIVDKDRSPGRFVLTGSQQFSLRSGISQSLAGRVGMNTLLPLAFEEIPVALSAALSLDDVLLRGSYPELYKTDIPTKDWMSSYIATYIERSVRQLRGIQDSSSFTKFLRLCASKTGQLLNIAAMASDAGISVTTAKSWISVLEASYVIQLLQPYHQNFGKRLIKSPKLYFIDTGLACWLLGIHTTGHLETHPARGALFETWAVCEFIKARYNRGEPSELYFWRDNNGVEADLMYATPEGIQTVEIKSGATVTNDSIRAGLSSTRMVTEPFCMPILLHGGDANYVRSGVRVIPWRKIASI